MRTFFRGIVQGSILLARIGWVLIGTVAMGIAGLFLSRNNDESDDNTDATSILHASKTIIGTRESVTYDEEGARIGAASGLRVVDD